jgi:HPt (histidine-containing phosphotransfer) domain-containing protein
MARYASGRLKKGSKAAKQRMAQLRALQKRSKKGRRKAAPARAAKASRGRAKSKKRCPECGRMFFRGGGYNAHIRNMHPELASGVSGSGSSGRKGRKGSKGGSYPSNLSKEQVADYRAVGLTPKQIRDLRDKRLTDDEYATIGEKLARIEKRRAEKARNISLAAAEQYAQQAQEALIRDVLEKEDEDLRAATEALTAAAKAASQKRKDALAKARGMLRSGGLDDQLNVLLNRPKARKAGAATGRVDITGPLAGGYYR